MATKIAITMDEVIARINSLNEQASEAKDLEAWQKYAGQARELVGEHKPERGKLNADLIKAAMARGNAIRDEIGRIAMTNIVNAATTDTGKKNLKIVATIAKATRDKPGKLQPGELLIATANAALTALREDGPFGGLCRDLRAIGYTSAAGACLTFLSLNSKANEKAAAFATMRAYAGV